MSKKRIPKAKLVEVDGKLISDTQKLDITDSTSFKFDFDSPLDFILFELTRIKANAKRKGQEEYFKYLDDMEEFLTTRVTNLQVYQNPGKEVPFKYEVNFTQLEGETKEEVEAKIKSYLTSNTFNAILAYASPQKKEILEILRQKEELRKQAEQIKKDRESLKKEQKKIGIKPKLRTGKHFIDNTLKNNLENQLPLFETLNEENKSIILEEGTSIEMINSKGEGINLSKGELKLLLCLAKVLQDKSNTIAPEKGDYYLGKKIEAMSNSVDILTESGNKITLKTPSISFTLYEITKEFILKDNPGGNDIKEVAKILHSLAYNSDKKALIRYKRKENLGKGRERITKIETYSPLVSIFNFEQEELLNGKKIDRAKEVLINLHPVFIDQIEKLYIELPLPKDVMEAYGNSNVSEIAFKLIFELSRALSNRRKLPKDVEGNFIYTIGVKKLQQKIAETYYKQSRYPLIKKYLDKATKTAKALGMLKDYAQEVGANGDMLYKFTLSKDW